MNDIESKPIKLPQKVEHPFKQMLKKRGIRMWQICQILGYQDSVLSRQLNGIRPMPEDVENLIRKILETADTKGRRQ